MELKCPCDTCIYLTTNEYGEKVCLLADSGIKCKRYEKYYKLWIRISKFNRIGGYKRNVFGLR